MGKLLKYYFNHKILAVVMLLVSFLLGFISTYFYNRISNYYTCDFTVSNIEYYNYDMLTDKDYLQTIKDSGLNTITNVNKYRNIDIDKLLKNNNFEVIVNENNITIKAYSRFFDEFFNSSTKKVGTRAKTFIKDAVNGLANDNASVTFADSSNIVKINKHANNYIVGLYTTLIGLVLILSILTIRYYSKAKEIEPFIYDNINTYKTIFHKSYFKGCFKYIKSIKDMCVIGMLFAIMMVCKFFKLPSGFSNLGLSFTYLFFAIISMIYGPVAGFVIGTFSDIIGYILIPDGIFFPLYTLQAAFTGMIYGFCLYKTSVNFTKVFLARLLVNMIMNVLFGSMCFGLLYDYDFDTTMSYMIMISLPKNLVYLLPQSLLLYYVIKMVSPILYRYKYMDYNVYKNIKLISD